MASRPSPRLAVPARASMPATARRALSFDPTAIYPWAALRAAAVLSAVLVVSLVLFGPGVAASAGLGALMAGVVSVSRSNRRPLHTMVATTAGLALSVFVGSAAGQPDWLHLVVLAVWAFGAGLLIALGDGGGAIGVQAIIAFVVFGRYAQPVGEAAKLAGYVAAGGMAQVLVSAVTRWSSALERQRRSVATAYLSLADLAGLETTSGSSAGDALDAAALTLSTPSLFRRPDLMPLRSLVEEGRRIRIELAALTGIREHLDRIGRHPDELMRAMDQVVQVLRAVAEVLTNQGTDGTAGPESPTEALARLGQSAAAITERSEPRTGTGTGAALRENVAERLTALAGKLRAVLAIAGQAGTARPRMAIVAGERVQASDMPGRVRAQLRVLTANLTLRSTACRHALRLAAVAVAAELIGDFVPLQRGYWVAVTAVIVLRPDFSATWSRGVARLAGTLIGAALVGLFAEALHPGRGGTVIAIGIVAFAAYLTFPASYAAYTVSITGLVVLLVSLQTPGTLTTTGDRVIDTLIGGALALAVYAVWPTWSVGDAHRLLAELARAERDYVAAVLDGVLLGSGTEPGRSRLMALARAVRLARSNAEAAVSRALDEPDSHGLDDRRANTVLDGLRRAALVAHALRTSSGIDDRSPAGLSVECAALSRSFTAAVSQTFDQIAAANDGSGPNTQERQPLRKIQGQLAGCIEAVSSGAFIAAETDELVDALNTVTDVLSDDRS